MIRGKMKYALGGLLMIALAAGGYVFYLYQQGGTEYYNPPQQKESSLKAQALSDLKVLSQAVDAYYAKNLKYPEKLDGLIPEFIDRVPAAPRGGNAYLYESDTRERYRITVSDPSRYGFKELFCENGEIVQK